ncbi:aminotransferase class I/II-fold pyridoxal phosphate-dependent enzyme [Gordonia sp. TBRC 11910]|uniref:Aminotransferase class I/II-fold pyridoxal phosphate-dependent enzyme n=1 Tax=Gordonia asplenii TaxID=2725283 RepID=A0A848L9U9_9ACTN|nr:aminotransferase class I/II-fold pyridoxal phosphate-dependent enzyme [Gordonia asplenii]NMO05231.1 aminotransferase class I/II-fold pyridoxal phosphate-dependent enzyme [Gordonia asplenii]
MTTGLRAIGQREPAHLNLDLNELAYQPLPAISAVLRAQAAQAHRYPEFRPDQTRAVIAEHHGVARSQVTVGAGATGVALAALQSCRRDAGRIAHPSMVTALPTFDGYPILARMVGLRLDGVRLTPNGSVDLTALFDAVGPSTVAVVVCSPHNPTGAVVDETLLHEFIEALPDRVTVVLDEAYVEFSQRPPDLYRLIGRHERVLVLRTFSKAYGLAGLRVGYGLGAPDLVARVADFEVPFAVGSAASAAVPVALSSQLDLRHRVAAMRAERDRLAARLASIGVATLPSEGNFLFLPGAAGTDIGRVLAGCGVVVKQCGTHGVRITVGDRASTDYVVDALRVAALTA